MEWTWFEKSKNPNSRIVANALTHQFSEDGVSYVATPNLDIPFWLGDPYIFGKDAELVSLLAQLEESQLAEGRQDALFLSWEQVFELQRSLQFSGSLEVLRLPPHRAFRLSLSSSNGLTDSDFSIAIDEWLDEEARPLRGIVQRVGATLGIDGEKWLLPEPTWRTAQTLTEFTQRPRGERDTLWNQKYWARIRRYAKEGHALLSNFLLNTVVLTPEKLKLGLRKVEFGDTKTIEIQPSFEGAPEQWLAAFDGYADVQERYDISTGAGMVQVVLEGRVKRVLEEIRRMPGRRVAGSRAEAFITNPFAALGEDASSVINESEFQNARTKAGLIYHRFTAHIESDGSGYPKRVALLIEEATSHDVTSEYYDFKDCDDLDSFCKKLELSISKERQLIAWGGNDLEILGDSTDQLRRLKAALAAWKKPRPLINYAEVFDLTRYSSRIEGIGVEKPIYSPFIAKKNEGESWFPENSTYGFWYTPEGETEPIAIVLPNDCIDNFKSALTAAKQKGEASFQFPQCPKPIPIAEAEGLIADFEAVAVELKSGVFKGSDTVSGKARSKRVSKTLLATDNVSKVGYSEGTREHTYKDNLCLPAGAKPTLPKALKASTELKEHQAHGVAWLQHLWESSPKYCRGAVLADDMGLGKTLQLLCFICSSFERKPDLEPALVVAPVSLLENWREEVNKFFMPETLPVVMLYGDTVAQYRLSQNEIDEQLRKEGITKFLRPGWAKSAKLVLTTYETLRDLQFSMAAEQWSIMVCDESQKIKNPDTIVSKAAKKQNVRFRVACTGTPVENTLVDLWNTFDFVQPGLLGALNEFGIRYRKPIEAETEEEKKRVEELRALIAPQILRRMKWEVAKDLPKKIEKHKLLPLSSKQATLYSHALSQFRKRNSQAGTAFKNHLGLLHYLRRVCSDPRPIGQQATLAGLNEKYLNDAPKMAWLLETLEEIKKTGEKAIIFVEFRDIQRVIQHFVRERFGFAADIINGDTQTASSAANSRHKRIKAFQEKTGFGVIILSPQAVGFGVNIQAANHVIHYTRTWNPAKEDQATDRAYRIGQLKDVHVHYPIAHSPDFKTFDAKLHELLDRKRKLATDMLNGNGDIAAVDFGDLEATDGMPIFDEERISIDDVSNMDPDMFECFCAALWAKQKYPKVFRTPKSGDGGIDVVAIKGSEGVIIQCKTAQAEDARLSWDAIKDVVTGAAAYQKMFPRVSFRKCAATNRTFNSTAVYQAALNEVDLIDQEKFQSLLEGAVVSRFDVEQYFVSVG